MALNSLKSNHLTRLGLKGLNQESKHDKCWQWAGVPEVQLRRLTVGLAVVFHAGRPAWQREATRDEGSHQGLVQTAAYNWASISDRNITGMWQHTHDAWCRVWHAKIYVLKLKCQHEGAARVLTFQLQDIYFSMSHESIMHHLFCCIADKNSIKQYQKLTFYWHGMIR